MLARRAGLLDWDRRSAKWAMVALVVALFVGLMAQRAVSQDMQASDPVGATTEQSA